ncbi:hypothetical protein LOK49_LG12G01740 [Camellia lanceoleosa]|uniref:Uncharacterized protein n=1 Tax=Camellia lanceoleosa TaxID=1840588 RepID=A0ACC0FP77_9ERIC|nr:hypothetical protein LOK49_LG12G01740 [Camellia lanceoleosa]
MVKRRCPNNKRSGSQATTSVDPTKSLNLAVAHTLISDSLATRSMKNLSNRIRSSITSTETAPQGQRSSLLVKTSLVLTQRGQSSLKEGRIETYFLCFVQGDIKGKLE